MPLEKYSEFLRRKEAEAEAEQAARRQGFADWLVELEARDAEDNDLESVDLNCRDRARQALEAGNARKLDVSCAQCDTELIHVGTIYCPELTHVGVILCPFCGFEDDDSVHISQVVKPHSRPLKDPLLQLLALMLSDPPAVLERQPGRLVLELSPKALPFQPFDLKDLSFTLQKEGTRLTVELRGTPVEPPIENPTVWEHVAGSDPEEPEEPVCELCHTNPIDLGSDRCSQCKNKKIFRHWLNR